MLQRLWKAIRGIFGPNILMLAATVAIAIFAYQQVRVTNRSFESEELQLRYALRADSTRIVTNVFPDSFVYITYWQNVSEKPVFNAIIEDVFVSEHPDSLSGDPLRIWPDAPRPRVQRLQMYPKDIVPLRSKILKEDFARTYDPKRHTYSILVRAYWKTPRGDGYGVVWVCSYEPETGEVEAPLAVIPRGKHFSKREINSAEARLRKRMGK